MDCIEGTSFRRRKHGERIGSWHLLGVESLSRRGGINQRGSRQGHGQKASAGASESMCNVVALQVLCGGGIGIEFGLGLCRMSHIC